LSSFHGAPEKKKPWSFASPRPDAPSAALPNRNGPILSRGPDSNLGGRTSLLTMEHKGIEYWIVQPAEGIMATFERICLGSAITGFLVLFGAILML
jgi:hypothetical protein